MQITELKHLKSTNPISIDEACIDGCHHLFVFKLEALNTTFEVFYKNQDTPYKVKQTAGARRVLNDEELNAVNSACQSRLVQEIESKLLLVDDYTALAKIIAKTLYQQNYEQYLTVAVTLYRSADENEMHYHLCEMLSLESDSQADTVDEVADSIIENSRALLAKCSAG